MTTQVYTLEADSGQPFLFTLAVYQYALMTAAFADVRLGPANLQVTMVTLMLVACAVIRREQVLQALGWQAVLVLAIGFVFIPFKMISGFLQLEGVQGMRLFFTLPLVWALYATYVTDDVTRNKVATIIIWNCVFIAVFGLVHFFVFPSVVLTAAQNDAYKMGNISLIPGHSQEAAFFGNPSGYGAILVTGLFAIYLTRRRSLTYGLAFLLITLATYISVSRAASLFATVIAILYLAGGVSPQRPKTFIPILAAVAAGAYAIVRFPFFLLAAQAAAGRWGVLGGGGGSSVSSFTDKLGAGRLEGYGVGVQIALGDLRHIFLGAADTEDIMIGDVNFSDNSFIFMALGFGLPLTLLWMATVLRRTVPMRIPAKLAPLLVLVFIYVTLITTPGLFWDMWLIYAVGLMFVTDDFNSLPAPVLTPAYG